MTILPKFLAFLIFFVIILILSIPIRCYDNVATKDDIRELRDLIIDQNCKTNKKFDVITKELKELKERFSIISLITSAVIYSPILFLTNLSAKTSEFFRLIGSFLLKIKLIRDLIY